MFSLNENLYTISCLSIISVNLTLDTTNVQKSCFQSSMRIEWSEFLAQQNQMLEGSNETKLNLLSLPFNIIVNLTNLRAA